MTYLSDLFSIRRRYTRSINLERDIDFPEAVEGYVPTEKAAEVFSSFLRSLSKPHSTRAWTLTGVYGTGKSAFAHFLTSISAPYNDPIRAIATQIAWKAPEIKPEDKKLLKHIPQKGLVRAVATAQREPLANAILRGLDRGARLFWNHVPGAKPAALSRLANMAMQARQSTSKVSEQDVLELVQEISRLSGTGVILVIDELGKVLEHATDAARDDDLYLLQQLAELPSGEGDPEVYMFGLLHQSFSDYASSLPVLQRNEWGKVHGRYEDVGFTESPYQVLKVLKSVIQRSTSDKDESIIIAHAEAWRCHLVDFDGFRGVDCDDIASIFPLHPVAAVTLPILCQKYAQNERSLFTFLSSHEPSSFTAFLKATKANHKAISTYKLWQLYDYFLDSTGMSISKSGNIQRWIEIQNYINQAKFEDEALTKILKTIAVLNLIASSGNYRASKDLVVLALSDLVSDTEEINFWQEKLTFLIERNIVLWRKGVDELRLWEGTDFDVEKHLLEELERNNSPLSTVLNSRFKQKPLIAQRHSYNTGTIRYFDAVFCDSTSDVTKIRPSTIDTDGLLFFWVDDKIDPPLVSSTHDNKPIVIVSSKDVSPLVKAAKELDALLKVESSTAQLQTDGVARRELKQRISWASRRQEAAFAKCFRFENSQYWHNGEVKSFDKKFQLNSLLSQSCDIAYNKSLILWNELINRRELTAQAATARKKLIEAMIGKIGHERFGLAGYGPERSMFESIFTETGIYAKVDDSWSLCSPEQGSGVYNVWNAIEETCLAATNQPVSVEVLFNNLMLPPFGVKRGVLPVILLAVLLKHSEVLALYDTGTFLPVLGAEHFELLVKNPSRFSVKHFHLNGIRAELFRQFEHLFQNGARTGGRFRNSSFLTVVTPLIKFLKTLPSYSLTTMALSNDAIQVRKALQEISEPDALIFEAIPKALGFEDMLKSDRPDKDTIKGIRVKLVKALRELNSAYTDLLETCKQRICSAFAIQSAFADLRQDLKVRATYLQNVLEPTLRRFLVAAMATQQDEREWVEGLLMVVNDKPADVWCDDDLIRFEMQISDIARRMRNLEALEANNAVMSGEGFEAKRICITSSDGQEVNQVIWIDKHDSENVNRLVSQLLNTSLSPLTEQMQKAILCGLAEKLFGSTELGLQMTCSKPGGEVNNEKAKG